MESKNHQSSTLILFLSYLFFFFFNSVVEATFNPDNFLPPISQFDSSLPPSPSSTTSIKKLCFNTDYPEICISSIIPYLTHNTKTDPSSILQILIKACNKTTQTAIDSATKITKNPKTPSTIISRIEDCKENFDSALDNLQSAIDAIPMKDFGTVNIMLSAVITNAETCNDGFVEGPGSNKNPLSYEGELIHKVASNCLAIASLIN